MSLSTVVSAIILLATTRSSGLLLLLVGCWGIIFARAQSSSCDIARTNAQTCVENLGGGRSWADCSSCLQAAVDNAPRKNNFIADLGCTSYFDSLCSDIAECSACSGCINDELHQVVEECHFPSHCNFRFPIRNYECPDVPDDPPPLDECIAERSALETCTTQRISADQQQACQGCLDRVQETFQNISRCQENGRVCSSIQSCATTTCSFCQPELVDYYGCNLQQQFSCSHFACSGTPPPPPTPGLNAGLGCSGVSPGMLSKAKSSFNVPIRCPCGIMMTS